MAVDYRENGVKVAMTTKGLWIVEQIAVSRDDVMEAMKIANSAMKEANKMLAARNRFKQLKAPTEEKTNE